MRYLPHTPQDIKEMLQKIGVEKIEELFSSIPEELKLKRELNLPPALDEITLIKHLEGLSDKNIASKYSLFLGGGAYNHHVMPLVMNLALRSEFLTAYTPYQPEVSQGTLQVIFEFQTLIAELFDMDIANASMYDGASAAAEAALMAQRITKKRQILCSESVHPEYREVISCYLQGGAGEVMTVPQNQGITDLSSLEKAITKDVAAVVVQYPNFFGIIEDLAKLSEICHKRETLLISVTTEPVALGVLKAPGTLGADIAVGEGQALGLPMNFGGPGIGLFTSKQNFIRQIPGRLVGETFDQNKKKGYVLTLATREQHIRRSRATSNICTNQALCALMVTIHLCALGRQGFKKLARVCLSRTEYLKRQIADLPGYKIPFNGPTFNEFVVQSTKQEVKKLFSSLEKEKILVGPSLENWYDYKDSFLVAVTEKTSKEEMDLLVAKMKKAF
jgi:glycine dehydrogenase subunit 1